jgi:hypothetical protein
MTYVINNYDGSVLGAVADRTADSTSTSLRLPGREYRPYGETVVENLVWMLQNFSGASAPLNPIGGQLWYDSSNKLLNVYDASTGLWQSTGSSLSGESFPPSAADGQIFYHQLKNQLFVRDITLSDPWRLVGPVGAADSSDPSSEIVADAHTSVTAQTVIDTSSAAHKILSLNVGGTVVAVISEDATFAVSAGAINGFPNSSIQPGINLRTGAVLNGVAVETTEATDAISLGGIAAANYMRRDASNQPTSNNTFDLGTAGSVYANIYATNFVGTASSATQADTANISIDAQALGGEPRPYYEALANSKLSLTGGTLSGDLTVDADTFSVGDAASSATKTVKFENTYGEVALQLTNTGVFQLADQTLPLVRFTSDTAGNFVAAGTVTGSSDARLKTNITPLTNGLALVEALQGVRFDRIQTGEHGVGVIAQQVREVVPELVIEDDLGMLSVAYGNITALLIEAVKELSQRVRDLEAGV